MKRLRENQALFEERQLFGIRKLKLGVASVAIAAAFSLGTASGHTTVAAESLTSVEPIDGAVMVKSGAADQEQGSNELPEATDISDIAGTSDVTKVSAAVNADTVKEVQPVAVPLVEDQAQEETTDQSQPSSSIVPVTTDSSLETPEATSSEAPIAAQTLRLHFKTLPAQDLSSLGLWVWDDVETPSDQLGGWPTGATNFSLAKTDDYGYYMDVKLSAEQAHKVSFLINNTK